MKIFLVVLCLFVVGCSNTEAKRQEECTAATAAKMEGKKIQKIRVNKSSVDFVLDEGDLVTIYSYCDSPIGIK